MILIHNAFPREAGTMENTKKSKTFWTLAGAAVAVYYFAPSILRIVTTPKTPKAPPAAVVAPAIHPSAPVPKLPPPLPPLIQSSLGKWQGAAVLPDRGTCALKLELRPNDTQNPVKAYSSLACGHTVIDEIAKGHKMTNAEMTKNFMRAANPTSAILSGSVTNGTIQLQAEQNFGVNAVSNGCDMVSITITPFASNQVIADFKESQQGRCQGGQIVLTKIR